MSACTQLSDRMPEVALGRARWTPNEAAHLAACADCRARVGARAGHGGGWGAGHRGLATPAGMAARSSGALAGAATRRVGVPAGGRRWRPRPPWCSWSGPAVAGAARPRNAPPGSARPAGGHARWFRCRSSSCSIRRSSTRCCSGWRPPAAAELDAWTPPAWATWKTPKLEQVLATWEG